RPARGDVLRVVRVLARHGRRGDLFGGSPEVDAGTEVRGVGVAVVDVAPVAVLRQSSDRDDSAGPASESADAAAPAQAGRRVVTGVAVVIVRGRDDRD